MMEKSQKATAMVSDRDSMLKKILFWVIVLIATCLSCAVMVIVTHLLRSMLLRNEEWIILAEQPYVEKYLSWGSGLIAGNVGVLIAYMVGKGLKLNLYKKFSWVVSEKKTVVFLIVIGAVLSLIESCGVSAVTDDHVVSYSLIHPRGVEYRFEDIESVEAGFKESGEFYYWVHVDGHTLKYDADSAEERDPEYEADYPYKAYSNFDNRLMKLQIQKTSNAEYIDKARSLYQGDVLKAFEKIVFNL